MVCDWAPIVVRLLAAAAAPDRNRAAPSPYQAPEQALCSVPLWLHHLRPEELASSQPRLELARRQGMSSAGRRCPLHLLLDGSDPRGSWKEVGTCAAASRLPLVVVAHEPNSISNV